MRQISIAKFEKGIVNEDAVIAKEDVIAVSDGAGGGGLFAERWSQYLVDHLPDNPIKNYKAFDKWIDTIWEPFYNDCEKEAQKIGGLLLNKFYDEGSFATLVAVWKNGMWISYGDSVAFCFNRKTKELQHSFTRLADFNNPPYLINCKDPLNEKGFRKGIIMMYEAAHKEKFAEELQEATNAQTKNSNFIKAAMSLDGIDFEKDVFGKLQNCTTWPIFQNHIKGLKKKGLIAHDDYSLAIL